MGATLPVLKPANRKRLSRPQGVKLYQKLFIGWIVLAILQ